MTASSLLIDNNTLRLQGEVTFNTLTGLIAQLEKMLTVEVVEFNCSEVTKADSSIIALLLYALQLAHQNKSTLKIVAVTDAIKKLLKLYGLEDLLTSNELASVH
jgi:phospholipid transport system transporter-binding protein